MRQTRCGPPPDIVHLVVDALPTAGTNDGRAIDLERMDPYSASAEQMQLFTASVASLPTARE